MTRSFTESQIERFRRDAKRLTRTTRLPLHDAQRTIANREGFSSWEVLIRHKDVHPAKGGDESSYEPINGRISKDFVTHIRKACVAFVNGLSGDDVRFLCWNGSIWIRLDDVRRGRVSQKSFGVLGSAWNSDWRLIGINAGMTPLVSFESLADRFVLATDLDDDDDGDPVVPLLCTHDLYSTTTGRQHLIEVVNSEELVDQLEGALQSEDYPDEHDTI